MIDSLPNRMLTKSEIGQIRDSQNFKEVNIEGQFFGLGPECVDAFECVTESGQKKLIYYDMDDGWVVNPFAD